MNMHSMTFHILVQWINFAGIVLLVGAVVFRSAVLNRGLRVFESGTPEMEKIKLVSQRDLKQWMGGCLILLTAVSLIDLILRAQMMSGKPFSEVFSILPLIVSKTHIGKTWLMKMVILGLFSSLWFWVKDSPRPGQQLLLLLACAGLCLTTSLSGHAADKGDFAVPLLADWFHVMAVACWAGGLMPLRLLMPKIVEQMDKKSQVKLQAAVISRFSRLAVFCVGVLILTGIYSSYLHLKNPSAWVTTPYGITLLFKLAFVVPVLGLGALSRYYIRPALQTLGGEPARESSIGRMAKQIVGLLGGEMGSEEYRSIQRGYGSSRVAMFHFQVFVALQCLLLVGVLGLAALLTQTSPPRAVEVSDQGNPEASTASQTGQKTVLMLGGSNCLTYPNEITKALMAGKGVKGVDLNSMPGHAIVLHDDSIQSKSLIESIEKIKGNDWSCTAEVMEMK